MMIDFTVTTEMISKYLANRKNEILLLRDLLQRRQYEVIANKAHNIKGNAASFGFPELGIIAQDMESAALQKRDWQVRQSISGIETWLQQLAPSL